MTTNDAIWLTGEKALIVFALAVACLLAPNASPGQEIALPDQLRGLEALGVVVDVLEPKLEKDGFSAADLRDYVEEKLRTAGLRILRLKEGLRSGEPFLEVRVGGFRDPSGAFYVIDLQFRLRHGGLVRRDKDSTSGLPWHRDWTGMVEIDKFNKIEDRLGDFLKEFIVLWRAQNPSK